MFTDAGLPFSRTPLQFTMLMVIDFSPDPESVLGYATWNSPAGTMQRHELYKLGLIRKNRIQQYELTEKGHAFMRAVLATPLPVKQEVVTTQWVVPKAA